MNRPLRAVFIFIVLSFLAGSVVGQKADVKKEIVPQKGYQALNAADSPALRSLLESAVKSAVSKYPAGTFKEGEIAATLIDLRDPGKFMRAEYHGDLKLYPASVVKMFYMAALERQLEDGKIAMTSELARGLRNMIVDSSNDATHYMLDVLTGTSGGVELPAKEFEVWQYKRNRVNRFFSSMGYPNINVNQKTFEEDAYGIEQQSRNFPTEAANRNKLTTNATARLMAEIVLGRITTPERTKAMMDLMKRDPFGKAADADDQNNGFTGKLFIDRNIRDVTLWSKAGWTSKSRHDAAYIETPDGLKFVLVVFTENHVNDRDPIPAIAGKVLDGLREMKK